MNPDEFFEIKIKKEHKIIQQPHILNDTVDRILQHLDFSSQDSYK